jgi:chemotaxis protein CheZ
MANNNFPPESLEQARALVSSLEAGNEADVHHLLDNLSKLRESSLFHELGKLTRELHETINSFHLDARIAALTQTDIPDAKERLNYVITMTEQAANRTLDAVEQSLPLSAQLQERAAGLRAPWQKARTAANGALNGVGDQIDAFIDEVENDAVVLQRNLSDALMAQDYQDLTGQIIRRVITLVHDVEENLVGLVRLSGQRMGGTTPAPAPVPATVESVSVLEGPRVPTLDKADSLKGQDDVDDLLSSLGF